MSISGSSFFLPPSAISMALGLEIVEHIHRHLVFPSAGHLDKGCQHSGVRGIGIEELLRHLMDFQQVILFFSVIITKYLFPCFFCSLGTILLYHSFRGLSRGFIIFCEKSYLDKQAYNASLLLTIILYHKTFILSIPF